MLDLCREDLVMLGDVVPAGYSEMTLAFNFISERTVYKSFQDVADESNFDFNRIKDDIVVIAMSYGTKRSLLLPIIELWSSSL